MPYIPRLAFFRVWCFPARQRNMDVVERVTIHRLYGKPRDFLAALKKDVQSSMTSSFKWFPTKYMYDEEGSKLFEQIS